MNTFCRAKKTRPWMEVLQFWKKTDDSIQLRENAFDDINDDTVL